MPHEIIMMKEKGNSMRYCILEYFVFFFLNIYFDTKSYVSVCVPVHRAARIIIMILLLLYVVRIYAKAMLERMPPKAIRISFTKHWNIFHWMAKRISMAVCMLLFISRIRSFSSTDTKAYWMQYQIYLWQVNVVVKWRRQQSRNIRIFYGQKSNNMCCVHTIWFIGIVCVWIYLVAYISTLKLICDCWCKGRTMSLEYCYVPYV